MAIAAVLILVCGAVVLFVTERVQIDLVALLVLASLLVSGLVTPEQGLSGFSNPATLTVAAMFVLSAGLQKTGAIGILGRLLQRVGDKESHLLLAVMVPVSIVSAFINNTATVAVFLPYVVSAAVRRGKRPSKLLIPLSYAAQFGGVCTLIGTSTNLLVHSIARRAGLPGFGLFEFGSLGLVLVGVGIAYILVVGRWLLPTRGGDQLTAAYGLGEYITELRVLPASPLVGQRVCDTRLGSEHDVTVVELIRDAIKLWVPSRQIIQTGDVLLVRGRVADLMRVREALKVELEPEFHLKDNALQGTDTVLVEALVAPNSGLIGRTLTQVDFRWRYNALVLAIQRRGQVLREKLANVRLQLGDAMLLLGQKDDITRLRLHEDFIILNELAEAGPRRSRAPLATGIVIGVVLLSALNLLPVVVAAVAGCAAMMLTGCLKPDEAYGAIDWRVILLLAGVLPLGIALESTGAATWITEHTVGNPGARGPVIALAMIYLMTAVLTEFMSNNAAAVLLAPIAISTAARIGVSPTPFLVAVAMAASTSFATPVGYQTNTMVYNAGGYRFTDFTKVGLPLNLVFWVVSVLLIPRFWPFHPV